MLRGDVGATVSACVPTVRAGGRLKEGIVTGKWGPQDNDTTRERAMGQGADEAAPLGRERRRARHDADRWGPPING